MVSITIEILMILFLILLNGLLAMSEFAVVTARKNRLQERANRGDRGASAALELAREPTDFLASVQIGITLVGVLAGAFGGATVAQALAARLANIKMLASYSQAIALALVVVLITFFTLVFGELTPKRLALIRPESLAAALARPMRLFARITAPLAWLLSAATDLVLRILRAEEPDEPLVTEDDLKVLISQATRAGVILEAEKNLVSGVFRLGDRRAGMLITPRTEIEWLDLDQPLEQNLRIVTNSQHSRFPVGCGSLDDVQGVVLAKDLLRICLSGAPIDLQEVLIPPIFVPENAPALQVLEVFKTAQPPIVMVIDEYGGLQGLLTIHDILEAFVGEITSWEALGDPSIYRRSDGSWLVDGRLQIDEFVEAFQRKTCNRGEKHARSIVRPRFHFVRSCGDRPGRLSGDRERT
ncbi:MAG: HlyC/CorC family transporter [Anaerolineales bacterium]|nr:HlyC/CorC family transporter [Anaerolineales bacterium]